MPENACSYFMSVQAANGNKTKEGSLLCLLFIRNGKMPSVQTAKNCGA
jgi:hypothetical protein